MKKQKQETASNKLASLTEKLNNFFELEHQVDAADHALRMARSDVELCRDRIKMHEHRIIHEQKMLRRWFIGKTEFERAVERLTDYQSRHASEVVFLETKSKEYYDCNTRMSDLSIKLAAAKRELKGLTQQ